MPARKRSFIFLRRKIIAYVAPMVILSFFSAIFSLFRMTEVNRLLEETNHISVPLGRLFAQIQSDVAVFHREFERNLGFGHWQDPYWQPKGVPHWIENVLLNELARVDELANSPLAWSDLNARAYWQDWAKQAQDKFHHLMEQSTQLYMALNNRDFVIGGEVYAKWTADVEGWKKQLQWASLEYERSIRQNFGTAEKRVAEFRFGLEVTLVIISLMSLLLLWLGERALRPLEDLTRLAKEITQQITRRGLRKEDKALLPEIPISRLDEVSQLAREFHHMATALLEREKTVQAQKDRLQEQNRLLREMAELNQRAENLAAVARMSAQVAHEVRNPLHSIGLEAEMAIEMVNEHWDALISDHMRDFAHDLGHKKVKSLKQSLQSILNSVDRLQKITENYLKLSRLSAGKKQEVDVEDVLESVLATYAPVCEVQGVEVIWERSKGKTFKTWADPDLLEQVLGNLFRNALQALESKDGPQAQIRLSVGINEAKRLYLKVEDNGPGIAPEVRSRLFTPFVTTRAHGTGLGLSFSKRVLEEQGGMIKVEERPMGQGACFQVIFPPMGEETREVAIIGGVSEGKVYVEDFASR